MMWRSWQRPGLRRKQSNLVDSRSLRDIASMVADKSTVEPKSQGRHFSLLAGSPLPRTTVEDSC